MAKVRLYHGLLPARKPITVRSPAGYELKFTELHNGKLRVNIRRPDGSLLLRTSLSKAESARLFAWLPK